MNQNKTGGLRKTLWMLLHFLMFLTGFYRADAYASGFEDSFAGEGTKEEPFLIASVDDLKLLRDNVDSGITYEDCYFAQTEDLVFSREENWEPIGDVTNKYAFGGCYDGRGHVMRQLYCSNKHAGLFALLSGEVRNLGIESGSFRGECIGSITSHGIGSPKIINCYNKASVTGKSRAGGITDNYPGKILFCWNLGRVSGEKEGTLTAGITSYGTASIEYCYTAQKEELTDDSVFLGTVAQSCCIGEDGADGMGMEAALLETYLAICEYPDASLVSDKNIVFLTAQDGNLCFSKEGRPDAYARVLAGGYCVEIFLAAAAVFFLICLGKRAESLA